MVSIRRGIFETNSSSTHALTILPDNRIDKDYFDLKYEIEDGYLRIRLPGNYRFHEYGDFETFTAKLGYMTALRIATYVESYYEDIIRPGEVEGIEQIDSWFSSVASRLLEHGVYIKGIDIALNYVADSDDYDDEDEEAPITAKGCKIDEDYKKSHHLKFEIDHQVVESFVEGEEWCKVFVRKPYKYYDGKEEVCDTICTTDGKFDDFDVLFSPKVGIRYTWDSDPVDIETIVKVEI